MLSAPAPQAGAGRRISFVAVSNLQLPGHSPSNSRSSSKSELNSHTYVYEPEDYADIHQLSVDALPTEGAYQPSTDAQRPTLDEILEGKVVREAKQEDDADVEAAKKGKVFLIYCLHIYIVM